MATNGNFRNVITDGYCSWGRLRIRNIDDSYFATFTGIVAENIQNVAAILGPSWVGRPSFVVRQTPRLTCGPEVRIERQQINFGNPAARKTAEGKGPAVW